jgi:hypothetical protein
MAAKRMSVKKSSPPSKAGMRMSALSMSLPSLAARS